MKSKHVKASSRQYVPMEDGDTGQHQEVGNLVLGGITIEALCDEIDRRLKKKYKQGDVPERLITTAARITNKNRGTPGGGRPRVLKACDYCGLQFGVVEMREHKRQHRK